MNEGTTTNGRSIEYLSAATSVSMGDDWYEYANTEHFWIKRRFEVFQKLIGRQTGSTWAEVGCGHGIVQYQVSNKFKIDVDGIDLNDFALQQNVANSGRLLCYDVLDRAAELHEAYDNVLLFDVLEHIDDDSGFLDATLHLLPAGGTLFVNVPAFSHFFSKYDDAAGHQRRYDFAAMEKLTSKHQLKILRWTYWGGPLIPLLVMRKAYFRFRDTEQVIREGFEIKNKLLNGLLTVGSRLEWIPQHIHGTSLMMVLEKTDCR